jgi:glutathione S-transferase
MPPAAKLEIYGGALCPYAQRVRALLTHLRIPFQLREVDGGAPQGPGLRLVDGPLQLDDSLVINMYLAERYGLADAFAADPSVRARERLAMVHWDAVVAPAFELTAAGVELDRDARRRLGTHFDEMVQTVYAIEQRVGGLLSLHCAPFWLRIGWQGPASPLGEMIAERVLLRRWLDQSAAMPAIQATTPSREAVAASR